MAHLSFHAGTEGKMKRNNLKAMLNHTLRKTMDKTKNHGNKLIDKSLTKNNIDWTKDNRPVDEIVEERIENDYKGKRGLRKDAVVLREVIIQASDDIYEGLTEEEKREKALNFSNDSLKWFAEEFGAENIIGASVHMDETNPHTHVMVMPMTEDGRMSQKDFFKGPKHLKGQHRRYREHMNALGWDFELENKYENIDGVPLPKYKANAKAIEAKRAEQAEQLAEFMQDEDVRQEAVGMVYNDVYDVVLRKEREELEKREKAAQKLEEEVKAQRAEFEDVKRATEAVVLGVLQNDADRDYLYKKVKEGGIESVRHRGEIDSVFITGNMIHSIKDAVENGRRVDIDVHRSVVQSQALEDDGPEL